ncbi:hypothetical protein CCR75_008802 [Bremia lactucae]|uniref:PX domain-containing protein n=1 Tax=Bremia lactucae TaxID=4779 RepID=A0A976FH82_BRELC|nr:hypothetical protein CCR75_008802 [Bremia lactucae]
MGVTSTASRKLSNNLSRHNRRRAMSIELPEATAWLENLHLRMETAVKNRRVHYEVHATYAQPCFQSGDVAWVVSYPFDAYRRFRKQLLRKLQPGHTCLAECKWLHSVVKKHFPKHQFLAANASRIVEARRESLSRILKILQNALINRGNQSCNVLVNDVCYDFAAFIFGNHSRLPDVSLASTSSPQRNSFDSICNSITSCGLESKTKGNCGGSMPTVDALCECNSDHGLCRCRA